MCLNAGFLFWVLCSKRSHWCIAMLVSLTIQNVRPLNTHWMSNQVRVWPIRDSDLVVMCGWRPLWHGSGARFMSKSKSKIWSKIDIASTFHTYLSNRLKRSRRLLLKYSLHFSLFLLLFSCFQRNKIMLSETVHFLSDIPLPQRSVLSLLMYVLHTALYFMSSI